MAIYPVKGKKQNGLQLYRVRVAYTDADGNHKQKEKHVYGKAEAQAAERDLSASVVSSPSASSSSPSTVDALIGEYLSVMQAELRESTLDKNRRTLSYGVTPIIGNIRLDKLDSRALVRWKDAVAKMDLSVRTKQNYYKTLHALLNFAVKRSYLPRNDLDRIGNFRGDAYFDTPEEKIRYYTAEQYLRFASFSRSRAESKNTLSEWSYYVFFSVAFYTGCRKGEINALRWTDLSDNVLHIRRSIFQKLKGEYRETPPKNRSSIRDLIIPAPLVRILSEHRARQSSMPGYTDNWYICGADSPIPDTTLEKYNNHISSSADLPHIRIHDFRHTHVSLLVNEGINIQEISRRLGHSDVKMTWNTYSHLYPREEERAVSVLDKIYLPDKPQQP